MGGATLPQPTFNDGFKSLFTKNVQKSIEDSLSTFSPSEPHSMRVIKKYKISGGKTIKTLNVEELHGYLLKSKRRKHVHISKESILIPDSECDMASWGLVRLLRVDYTARKDGVTALMWSGHIGDLNALKLLLSQGAYLDRQLPNGNTVLMETILAENDTRLDCLRVLLSAGAKINLENQEGHTAVTLAASLGNLQLIKLLLSKRHRVNLDHKTKKGHSVLTMAAVSGNLDTVRYLVENYEVDLLAEDKYFLTALCWAHVESPPVAAYLSIMITVKDKVNLFIKRRLEVLEKYPNDLDLLSTFFSVALVFVQIRSVRDCLIRNGSLTSLLTHSQWENIDHSGTSSDSEGEDSIDELMRDFNRILPWMIALTCAMMYNDTYVIEKFIQSASASKYLGYVNLLKSGEEDVLSLFLVQASLLPIMASERGRLWLVDTTAQNYPLLLKHIADMKDHMSNSIFDFITFFMEVIGEQYSDYNLKALKDTLDEQTRSFVFPEPAWTLRTRLMDIIACYESLKHMAQQRLPKDMEDPLKSETEVEVTKETDAKNGTPVKQKHSPEPCKPRQRRESISTGNANESPSLRKAKEDLQRLWIDDFKDSAETKRGKELDRVRALPEMEAFKVEEKKPLYPLVNSPKHFPERCDKIKSLYQEDIDLLHRKEVKGDSDVITLSHRTSEGNVAKPQQAKHTPKKKTPTSTRDMKWHARMKKQDNQKERKNQRDCKIKIFSSDDIDTNPDTISSHYDRKLSKSFYNNIDEFPSLPGGAVQQVEADKETIAKTPIAMISIAQSLLKPSRYSAVVSMQPNLGSSVASPTFPPTTPLEETQQVAPVTVAASSLPVTNEIDLYGPSEYTEESQNEIQENTAEDQKVQDMIDFDSSLDTPGAQVFNIPVTQSATDCPKETNNNGHEAESASIFMPSIHDNSLLSSLTELVMNKQSSVHNPDIAFSASELENKLNNLSNNINDSSFLQSGVYDKDIYASLKKPNSQGDWNWAQANPICHSLHQLHATVSGASIGSEGYGSSPPSPPNVDENIDKLPAYNLYSTGTNIATLSCDDLSCFASLPKSPPGFNTSHSTSQNTPQPANIKWAPKNGQWKHLFKALTAASTSDMITSRGLVFVPDVKFSLSQERSKAVYVGLQQDGSEVAVKQINKNQVARFAKVMKTLCLKDVTSENILIYNEIHQVENTAYIEMEMCECSLETHLKKLQRQDNKEVQARSLCHQLLTGLSVLHAAGILHMNLKPSNILIDHRGRLRLADFGVPIALQSNQPYEKYCWRPLEVISGGTYSSESDIQGAGMLLHYIVTGRHPYGKDAVSCRNNIRNNSPDLANLTDNVFFNLLTWMLHPDISRRKDAVTCLIHPYFWDKEKRFCFLKTVCMEPEMACRISVKDPVPRALNAARKWMGVHNTLDPLLALLMEQLKMDSDENLVRLVLRIIVQTKASFSLLPEILSSQMQDPVSFFMQTYERVFLGTYDIIRQSPWRKRYALITFFNASTTF